MTSDAGVSTSPGTRTTRPLTPAPDVSRTAGKVEA